MDADFAKDVEAAIESHREPLNRPHGLILDSSVIIAANGAGKRRAADRAHSSRDRRPGSGALGNRPNGTDPRTLSRQNSAMRLQRQSFLDELLADLTVYPYTKETAMLAGKLDGEQQSKGVVIPFGDLLIGATALSLGFPC